jgi:hypothetical protein
MHTKSHELMQEKRQIQMKRLCIIKYFVIWREMCAPIFRETYKTPQQMIIKIMEKMKNWIQDDHGLLTDGFSSNYFL